MDWTILAVGSLFAVSSVAHACFNSFYTSKLKPNRRWLLVHYALTAVFGLCVALLVVTSPDTIRPDLVISASFVAIVHVIRFWTDFIDLRGRSQQIDWIRPVIDFAANLSVIWFVLSVLAGHHSLLYLAAAFFAFMMIFKELKYRIYDDAKLRPGHSRTSSQGGQGAATAPATSKWQAYLGRLFKSYFYILVGFSLAYLCLSRLAPETTGLITDDRSTTPFLDGLAFTCASLAPAWKRGTPIAIIVTILLQFATNAIVLIWFATTIQDTVDRPKPPAPRRRNIPPPSPGA